MIDSAEDQPENEALLAAGHGQLGRTGCRYSEWWAAGAVSHEFTEGALMGRTVILAVPLFGIALTALAGCGSSSTATLEVKQTGDTTTSSATPSGDPGEVTRTAPTDDSATTGATPAVSIQDLRVEPVTDSPANCEGTYGAGQQLSVSGDGFLPGAAVRIFVSARGLGATGEQQVAQLAADSTGQIAATVSIPPAATGFTPGANAGIASIDAIGLGPEGVHVDDTAMIGLAPNGSPCGAPATP
jgi:hypothetical protein